MDESKTQEQESWSELRDGIDHHQSDRSRQRAAEQDYTPFAGAPGEVGEEQLPEYHEIRDQAHSCQVAWPALSQVDQRID